MHKISLLLAILLSFNIGACDEPSENRDRVQKNLKEEVDSAFEKTIHRAYSMLNTSQSSEQCASALLRLKVATKATDDALEQYQESSRSNRERLIGSYKKFKPQSGLNDNDSCHPASTQLEIQSLQRRVMELEIQALDRRIAALSDTK